MSRRNIEIGDDQWRAVKAKAAMRGQTIAEFFAQALDEVLSTDTKPPYQFEAGVTGSGPVSTPDTFGGAFNTRPFTPVPKKGK